MKRNNLILKRLREIKASNYEILGKTLEEKSEQVMNEKFSNSDLTYEFDFNISSQGYGWWLNGKISYIDAGNLCGVNITKEENEFLMDCFPYEVFRIKNNKIQNEPELYEDDIKDELDQYYPYGCDNINEKTLVSRVDKITTAIQGAIDDVTKKILDECEKIIIKN